jgi:2-haloacid dehalogenase
MAEYSWLLLDADGTLFDYDRAETSALSRTFEQFGHRFKSGYVEIYRHINASIWRAFERGEITPDEIRVRRFELLFDELPIESDPVAFSQGYLKHLSESTYLVEGAEETVRALHGKVGLVLLTNGLKEVQRPRLTHSAIGRHFTDIVISEEVGASKPHRGIFDAAFERMGQPRKEEVLIVGDGLASDIKGGSDYGIDTCWYNPAGRMRDLQVEIRYEIRHLRELLPIVGVV